MKPKEFFRKWKEGIDTLPHTEILKGKVVGFAGGTFGLILAITFLILTKNYAFIVFLLFMTWIQILSFIETRQQWINAKKILEEIPTAKAEEILEKMG